MGCSVGEAQAKITSEEFNSWRAYDRVEPFGSRAEDRRIGTLIAVLVNIYRKKGSKALTWLDIFPEYKSTTKKSPEELLAAVISINQALGGEDLRNG